MWLWYARMVVWSRTVRRKWEIKNESWGIKHNIEGLMNIITYCNYNSISS